jgi:hypothetical protein
VDNYQVTLKKPRLVRNSQFAEILVFYFRTSLSVKITRIEKVLEFLKWTFFTTCLALCIWKVADSFITFGEKEVGTKIELKYNYETDLPGFAVCRHPNQILTKFDGDGKSLLAFHGLNLSDIRYLKAFENADSMSEDILDLYKKYAFNDSSSVKNIALSSRGQYAGTSTPSLVSNPQSSNGEWSTLWHPLYGNCFLFQLQKPLVDVVGEAGLEFVKINLDFEKAFPVPKSDDEVIVIIEENTQPGVNVIKLFSFVTDNEA